MLPSQQSSPTGGEVRASYVVRHLHPHEPELLALVGEYEEHLQVLVYQWLEDFIEQIVPDRQELPVYRRRPGVSLTGLQVALEREGERVFDFADEDPF